MAVVGDPEITAEVVPVTGWLKDNPGGSVLLLNGVCEMVNVYGKAHPVTVIACEYGEPILPLVSADGVRNTGVQDVMLMVTDSAPVRLPSKELSDACTTMGKLPPCVGVPDNRPAALKIKPGGKPADPAANWNE